ncbi:tRNA-specific adenosine deaminase 2 [Rhipicephalus sanguineus]|nr:tRNA-specific adenosine deaminase 2 [Rhipicephalus sanguineus]
MFKCYAVAANVGSRYYTTARYSLLLQSIKKLSKGHGGQRYSFRIITLVAQWNASDICGNRHKVGPMAATSFDRSVMSECFRLAEEALSSGEVPVGCVMVYDGEAIIARDRNRVNESRNACRHAEMGCIEQVLAWCADRRLHWKHVFPATCVYVTVEPCIMCASALSVLGVSGIVFGCANERFGGMGSVLNCIDGTTTRVVSGVWAERAVDLLKTFYAGENPNAPKVHGKSV